MSRLTVRRTGWVAMTFWATVIGLVSLRYALPHVPHPVLTNFVTHRTAFRVHAASASVALLAGPWQFRRGLRQRRPVVHRVVGRLYVAAVAIGWIASIPVALHAQTGLLASAGFLSLGLCWISATTIGLLTILRGRVADHRRWMIRSYALTAAAITLRIYLGTAATLHLPFNLAYPAIAWLCWAPNLLVTEIALRLSTALPRSSAPAPLGDGRPALRVVSSFQ